MAHPNEFLSPPLYILGTHQGSNTAFAWPWGRRTPVFLPSDERTMSSLTETADASRGSHNWQEGRAKRDNDPSIGTPTASMMLRERAKLYWPWVTTSVQGNASGNEDTVQVCANGKDGEV